MSIVKKVQDLIAKRGITQSDLAKRLKIAQPNLNRMLRSDDMKVSLLISISKALGVKPSFFFDDEIINSAKRKIDDTNSINKSKVYAQTLSILSSTNVILGVYEKQLQSDSKLAKSVNSEFEQYSEKDFQTRIKLWENSKKYYANEEDWKQNKPTKSKVESIETMIERTRSDIRGIHLFYVKFIEEMDARDKMDNYYV